MPGQSTNRTQPGTSPTDRSFGGDTRSRFGGTGDTTRRTQPSQDQLDDTELPSGLPPGSYIAPNGAIVTPFGMTTPSGEKGPGRPMRGPNGEPLWEQLGTESGTTDALRDRQRGAFRDTRDAFRDTRDQFRDRLDDTRDAARSRIDDARQAARERIAPDARSSGDFRTSGDSRTSRDFRTARNAFDDPGEWNRRPLEARDWNASRFGGGPTIGFDHLRLDALEVDDFGLDLNLEGDALVVADISADSAFSQFGLLEGDIIASVNGQVVMNDEQFIRALFNEASLTGSVPIDIIRDGVRQTITVTPSTLLGVLNPLDFVRINRLRGPDFGLWFDRSRNSLIVANVAASGAISQFGFLEGDRILTVNGRRITNEPQFVRALFDDATIEGRVPVEVVRDGEVETLFVEPNLLLGELTALQFDPIAHTGFVLDDRFDDQVVVWRVTPRTPAFYAGIRPGDVIAFIGDVRIESQDDLVRVLRDSGTGLVDVQVVRNGRFRDLQIELPELSMAVGTSVR